MKANFKEELVSVVQKETLKASSWTSFSWEKLARSLNQDILNDAYFQHEKMVEMFAHIGTVIPRTCKKMERITKKIEEVAQKQGEYFKVVSDLVAGRINCDVKEIPIKVSSIKDFVSEKGGFVYIRGETPIQTYGCLKNGKFVDITQYVYVFLDDIHYPIEFQIGHEFAAYTFTIDSLLRDNPGPNGRGVVDLWTDGFYEQVKKYLLKKANGDVIALGSKYEIWDLAFNIHKNSVPEELGVILNKF